MCVYGDGEIVFSKKRITCTGPKPNSCDAFLKVHLLIKVSLLSWGVSIGKVRYRFQM